MKNIVSKGWGYELWIENNEDYCLKQLCVLPRKWCSVHYHVNKHETFYVLSGSLYVQYHNSKKKDWWEEQINKTYWIAGNVDQLRFDDTSVYHKTVRPGDSFYIDKQRVHRFTSFTNEPCVFMEASTHHDDNDSYRIIKGD